MDDKDEEMVREVYTEQTPSLWNKGMANDKTILWVLAIGRVHRFDYLR